MEETTKAPPSRAAKIALWGFFAAVLMWFTGAWIPVVNGAINVVYGGPCGTLESGVVSASRDNTPVGTPHIIGIINGKEVSGAGIIECRGTALLSDGSPMPITYRLIVKGGKQWVYFEPSS